MESLKITRDKYFAHKDKDFPKDFKLPTFEKLDAFIDNLYKFYNELTGRYLNAGYNFIISTDDQISQIDFIFSTLYNGIKVTRDIIDANLKFSEYGEEVNKFLLKMHEDGIRDKVGRVFDKLKSKN